MMRLLVVEDDRRTAEYLARGLAESGHVVDCAGDGATGLAMAHEGIYDVIVIDRRLPGLDGIELIGRLRLRDVHTPALMISGQASTTDCIEGLRAGCDDYLVKPYAFAEILARIEALGRRADKSRQQHILRIADLALDTRLRTARRGGCDLKVQHREYLLLELLMRQAGQVVTRDMLLEAAWDYNFEPRGNIIDMHMHRLRRKVDDGFAIALIHTIAGAGYLMGEPA
jgi:two-component system, OmpR family, response regulator